MKRLSDIVLAKPARLYLRCLATSVRHQSRGIIAITGPSGCGKTTLLKCMMGLIPVNQGQILFDEEGIHQNHQLRLHMAVVMQDDQLLSASLADIISSLTSHVQ